VFGEIRKIVNVATLELGETPRLREEFLTREIFYSLREAQVLAEQSRIYLQERKATLRAGVSATSAASVAPGYISGASKTESDQRECNVETSMRRWQGAFS
jgi:hypothetical protein